MDASYVRIIKECDKIKVRIIKECGKIIVRIIKGIWKNNGLYENNGCET